MQSSPLSWNTPPFWGILVEEAATWYKLRAGQRAWSEVQSEPTKKDEDNCFCLLVILTCKTLLGHYSTQRMLGSITKIA